MSRDSTVHEQLHESIAALATRQQWYARLLRILPDLPARVSMSNEGSPSTLGVPTVFLTFSPPSYVPAIRETFDPASLLRRLEAAEHIRPVPVTLVQWDKYRPSFEPGRPEDIPPVSPWGKYTRTSAVLQAPVWVTRMNTDAEAHMFYLAAAPDVEQLLLRVTVPLPQFAGYATADREAYRGGWRWKAKSERIVTAAHLTKYQLQTSASDPESSLTPPLVTLTPSHATRVYPTDTMLDATWAWHVEPDDAMPLPSAMVEALNTRPASLTA